jgi:hypothetical protein
LRAEEHSMIGRSALVLAVVLMTAACGNSSSNKTVDGAVKKDSPAHVADAPAGDASLYDFGCGGNTACPIDQICCAMPGHTPAFGCVAMTSCPAADKIACDGPDECGGATPVCCGVDVPNGSGTFPQCGISTLGTSCTSAAACPTHLGTTCSDTTKVQICHVASECTDAAANKCCTFMSSGAELTFCTDALTASLGNATCH